MFIVVNVTLPEQVADQCNTGRCIPPSSCHQDVPSSYRQELGGLPASIGRRGTLREYTGLDSYVYFISPLTETLRWHKRVEMVDLLLVDPHMLRKSLF